MTKEERGEIEDVLVALALCFLQDPQRYDAEINQRLLEEGDEGARSTGCGRLVVSQE